MTSRLHLTPTRTETGTGIPQIPSPFYPSPRLLTLNWVLTSSVVPDVWIEVMVTGEEFPVVLCMGSTRSVRRR